MTVQIRSRWALALVVASVLVPAAPAAAQQADTLAAPSTRTHTVRTGDTLWDLARTYLADPFLWPEIYRLNTEVVEDPHWIYPNEVLRLPADAATPGITAMAPEAGAGEEAPPSRSATVFASRRGSGPRDRMQRGVLGRSERPLVRPGDWYPAPAVVAEGGIPGSGRVRERVEETGIASQRPADRLQIADRISITLPSGQVGRVGDRYLAYRLDELLTDGRQVMVPTGVVTVEALRPSGEAIARIVDLYDHMRVDQRVTTFEPFTPVAGGEGPQPLTGGPSARVVWIQNAPVLPSLHQYLVLDGGQSLAKTGDQFTLLREGVDATGATPGPDAPETLAVVQVIKVAPGGITAMVIDQAQPGLQVGTRARLTAKMP